MPNEIENSELYSFPPKSVAPQSKNVDIVIDKGVRNKEDKAEAKLLHKKFHSSALPWSPKQLTALVSSIAALVAGIAAWHKPPEEPTAEMVYKVLAQARQEDIRLISQNHDDIVTLRFWLSQYLSTQGIDPDNPKDSRMAPVVSPIGSVTPPPAEIIPPASKLFDRHTLSPIHPKIGKTDIKKMPALPDFVPPTISVTPLPRFDTVKKTNPEDLQK